LSPSGISGSASLEARLAAGSRGRAHSPPSHVRTRVRFQPDSESGHAGRSICLELVEVGGQLEPHGGIGILSKVRHVRCPTWILRPHRSALAGRGVSPGATALDSKEFFSSLRSVCSLILLAVGATGERTDLNRGESHAPIRSRSTVSVGGGDTTLGSQTIHGTTFGIESAAADRVCANYRTLPPAKNDIEFVNVPRRRCAIGGSKPVLAAAVSYARCPEIG